ncbi:MAG: hypothetical protein AMXMBFR66_02910 [Pseudomonadota bacterium]
MSARLHWARTFVGALVNASAALPAPYRESTPSPAGRGVAVRAALLALALVGTGCAMPQHAPGPAFAAHAPAHRIHVVFHGWHSGIAVRAADVPAHEWPARRDLPQAEFLEVGWGNRAYYMAAEPSLWLGLRALLWPAPGVLHVAAFDGPPERAFPGAGIIELALTAPGFDALVATVRDSHAHAGLPRDQVPEAGGRSPSGAHGAAPADRPGQGTEPGADAVEWPPPLGPGLYGASRFYASRERFHLFRTCNVWTASVLAVAGVPMRPATALTAEALFAQVSPHGRVLRAPP